MTQTPDIDDVIAQISAIRQSHLENRMARHFNETAFRALAPDGRARLLDIFASGIANPDSQMGAYAQQPDDYDVFQEFLEPMIRDHHGIDARADIRQVNDWGDGSQSHDLSDIDPALGDLSARVRVARNAADFPLPGAMDQDDRVAFEERMIEAFSTLITNPNYGGEYLSLTPGSPYELTPEAYQARVAAHQMFKDMSGDPYLDAAGISNDWPYGRGMYVSADEQFLIWVGEEDHLRVMAMQRGGTLGSLFDRLQSGLAAIEALGPRFAHSSRYGFITSCPTNLGAGMRASAHLPLPKLTKRGSDLSAAKALAKQHGLAVRGVGGEHTEAGSDGRIDISPGARLMVTEGEIRRRLYDGIAALWAAEKQAPSA